MKVIPKEKRHWKRNPWQYAISRVMCEFVSTITWVKRESVQSYFSRENKKLTDYNDVYEYLKEKKYLD